MRTLIRSTALLLLLWLYTGTCPVNHTEADVAYRNAFVVEQGGGDAVLRADEVLYLTGMRFLHRALTAAGWGIRAFDMMVLCSSVCAVATVYLFFLFCYRRYSLRPLSSLLASALFAVSYGFWRYACEAETIVPATLAALGAFYMATSPVMSVPRIVLTSVVAAVAMLLSVLHVGGMLVVIPLYFLMGRRPRHGAVYLGITAGCLILGLAAMHSVHGPYMAPYPQLLAMRGGLSLGTLAKAVIGLGQSWLSGNFLLGFEGFRRWLVEAFPYRMLAEEVFLGRQLDREEIWAAVASFVAAILLTLFSILLSLRLRRLDPARAENGTTVLKDGRRAFVGVAVWAAVYIGSILWLQPENAGVWAFGLAPIWLAFCGVVIVPLARHRTLWPVLAMALVVGVHNYWGGIRLFGGDRGDVYVAASEWMLARARPDDGILLRRWTHFAYWIGLRFPGAVEVLESWKDPEADWSRLKQSHPRIWAWGILFEPRDIAGYPAQPDVAPELGSTLRVIKSEFREVQSGEAGTILLWERR